jgi:hypothetical protein
MITFTWKIISIQTFSNPIPNYVAAVNYLVTGIDDSNPPNVASIQGYATFSSDKNQKTYIPYSKLTENIVLDWIQADKNLISNMEANVQGQINTMINPPEILQNAPLPWITT